MPNIYILIQDNKPTVYPSLTEVAKYLDISRDTARKQIDDKIFKLPIPKQQARGKAIKKRKRINK